MALRTCWVGGLATGVGAVVVDFLVVVPCDADVLVLSLELRCTWNLASFPLAPLSFPDTLFFVLLVSSCITLGAPPLPLIGYHDRFLVFAVGVPSGLGGFTLGVRVGWVVLRLGLVVRSSCPGFLGGGTLRCGGVGALVGIWCVRGILPLTDPRCG